MLSNINYNYNGEEGESGVDKEKCRKLERERSTYLYIYLNNLKNIYTLHDIYFNTNNWSPQSNTFHRKMYANSFKILLRFFITIYYLNFKLNILFKFIVTHARACLWRGCLHLSSHVSSNILRQVCVQRLLCFYNLTLAINSAPIHVNYLGHRISFTLYVSRGRKTPATRIDVRKEIYLR